MNRNVRIAKELVKLAKSLVGGVRVHLTNNEEKLATALKLHVFGTLSGDADLICQLPNKTYFVASCEGVVDEGVSYTCYVCNRVNPATGAMSTDAKEVGEISDEEDESKCGTIAHTVFSAI